MSYTTQYSNGETISQTLILTNYDVFDIHNIVDYQMALCHKLVKESMDDLDVQENTVPPTYVAHSDKTEYTSYYKYNQFIVSVKPIPDSFLEIRAIIQPVETKDYYESILEKSNIQEIAFVGVLKRIQEHAFSYESQGLTTSFRPSGLTTP
jgi:hypothetical protein